MRLIEKNEYFVISVDTSIHRVYLTYTDIPAPNKEAIKDLTPGIRKAAELAGEGFTGIVDRRLCGPQPPDVSEEILKAHAVAIELGISKMAVLMPYTFISQATAQEMYGKSKIQKKEFSELLVAEAWLNE